MADNRQYTALEWVIKEINETLQESQRVLENYANDPQDITQLRFCQTLIHQVYGSLHMVGFHGASMLAEEMETLAQAMLDDQVSELKEALEVLMRAILQLPSYLEQVQHTKRDYPATVLSLLNDIRSVRGESLLSESTLFTPNLDPAHALVGNPHPITQDNLKFQELASKLRKMYQYAAASVIHKINVDENLSYLLKAAERTQKLLQGTKRYSVWEIAYAVIDGLNKKIIQPSTTIKGLLRELDGELKILETKGIDALSNFPAEDLLKNLLFYIGSSGKESPSIEKIRQRYELNNLMPLAKVSGEEKGISSVDSHTLRAVGNAIREEFIEIKDRLDDCIHGGDTRKNLDVVQTALQRVNDTLAILGVGELRQTVNNTVVNIENIRHQTEGVSKQQLMNIAHALTDIEIQLDASLLTIGGDQNAYHLDEAQSVAVEECRNGLEKAKDAIVDYIATQWSVEYIESVPAILREVRGNLSVLLLQQASDILSGCILYIESQLIEKKIKPKWQQLDSLADVIASVDYYLEFMSVARENDATILDKAQSSLESLGVAKATVELITPTGRLATQSVPDESTSQPSEQAENSNVSQTDSAQVEEQEDPIDKDVVDIFIDEVAEIQEHLNKFFVQWANDIENKTALTEIRRSFHTLKGSGRMVRAGDISELAWSIENMLNRILDHTIEPSELQVNLITKVIEILPALVSAYRQGHVNPYPDLTKNYIAWGHALSRNERLPVLIAGLTDVAETDDVETTAEQKDSQEQTVKQLESSKDDDIDTQLWDIFRQEAEGYLTVVNEYIEQMDSVRPFYQPPSDPMQRALHTLKGSAHMAELTTIAELMTPLEKFAKELRSYQVAIDDDIFQLIKDGVSYTQDALSDIEQHRYPQIPKYDQFMARLNELRERSVAYLIRQEQEQKAQQKVDPAILEVLMAEEMNLLLDADLMLEQWQKQPASTADWQPLHDELANLTHGAERANLPSMVNVSRALQNTYQQLISGEAAASNDNYCIMLEGHNHLMDIVDAIAAGQDLPPENAELIAKLTNLHPTGQATKNSYALNKQSDESLQYFSEELTENVDVNLSSPNNDLTEDDVLSENVADESVVPELSDNGDVIENDVPFTVSEDLESASQSETETEFEPFVEASQKQEIATQASNDDVDEETVEIFLEEAVELLENLDESIHDWENGTNDLESNESMQRALHTFKGGARLSGLSQLGDTAHNFEAYLIKNLKEEANAHLFEQVHQYQDQLIHQVDGIRKNLQGEHPATDQGPLLDENMIEAVDSSASDENFVTGSNLEGLIETSSEQPSNIVPFTVANKTPSPLKLLQGVPQTNTGGNANGAAARRPQPQEVVKVSADLMEELVNLAGETSISRGRMEEQISELGYSLDEMGSTVQRLQEQLRRLDIETEAQIIFRQEQMAESDEFDPLEMDRYSQLQQLSRSLIESASDLMDLKGTLADKARDAETVLLQQSRINTDLQEGLMRSRMVPFSRIVPRLRRIVRQISSELDKDVNLELGNIEGELDRSMMERMVAPLEHMLRNAIDHGIENSDTRLYAGKQAQGRIVITLERDGGDVLIHVADDGRGIDVVRVRDKAIERNLMNIEAQLSDQEIIQFILHAGFSTADTITQISGRGVGMDVVNSEIRQMGGSISIDSRLGEGTAFTIRVPFTVSVNRALMISMGDDRYAIPLNTIEGILRISPFELDHYYANPEQPFEYAGQDYQLRYLGTLLDSSVRPRMQGHSLPLPVLLVRSADHSIAIQVDNLQGSREIVVKSLGPQFRSVLGVSGATIMGDGHVVVILDPNAMIRRSVALNLAHMEAANIPVEPTVERRNPIVMVVDDSVTVRKVTTRLLEREGYEVITAKDGVDAMTMLQDQHPDIMLLDIEMPRMDGFEVAKNVRSSFELKQLPIIMITSRTGEKHRLRGLESGANLYMGKPYQEEQLLESIRELTQAAIDADT